MRHVLLTSTKIAVSASIMSRARDRLASRPVLLRPSSIVRSCPEKGIAGSGGEEKQRNINAIDVYLLYVRMKCHVCFDTYYFRDWENYFYTSYSQVC